MYGKDVQGEAHKAAEDLRIGIENGDITKAIQDIADLNGFFDAEEQKAYFAQINKETAAVLPDVEIVGAGAQNLIVADRTSSWNRYYVPGNRPIQLQELDLPSVSFDKHEMRGDLDVTVNENNEVTSVTRPNGDTYRKVKDGEWNLRGKYGSGTFVDNLQVSEKGDLSFDTVENHSIMRADGSQTAISKADGTKYEWDTAENLVEMPAGHGRVRKFHYDENNEIDQIDGNLGHWERRFDKNNQMEWVNTNTRAVWKGKLWVDSEGNLRFTARDGHHWAFKPDGKSETRSISGW